MDPVFRQQFMSMMEEQTADAVGRLELLQAILQPVEEAQGPKVALQEEVDVLKKKLGTLQEWVQGYIDAEKGILHGRLCDFKVLLGTHPQDMGSQKSVSSVLCPLSHGAGLSRTLSIQSSDEGAEEEGARKKQRFDSAAISSSHEAASSSGEADAVQEEIRRAAQADAVQEEIRRIGL